MINFRIQLERKIDIKKQEIAETEAKLRELQAFIQGLQEALKVLPRDGSVDTDRALREGSNMAKARDCLTKSGRPMHIKDILKGIGKENTRNNRSSVGASLASYSKKGEIFTKTAPNTYGLIEFEQQQKVDDGEFPDNFGLDDDLKEIIA